MSSHHYDITIIGAGPAGCAAALALRESGLKVALLDKAVFPRKKTCGDAIPGPAIKALHSAFPFFQGEFQKLKEKQKIKNSSIFLENGRSIDYHWKDPAYNIRRSIWDEFLLELVQKHSPTELITGIQIDRVEQEESLKLIPATGHAIISSKMHIGCDGAGSVTAKSFNHRVLDSPETVMAVRAYYRGLKLSGETNHFYVFKKHLPGYFWAFPLGDGIFNLGFGMKARRHGKTGINIKDVLTEIINDKDSFHLFNHAEQLSEVSSAIIPIGGKRGQYSGNRFVLTGDAAHLADPLQGHGIDKAVFSGILAASHAISCFNANDFSAAFNLKYDKMIRTGIEKELRKNRYRQIMLSKCPGLLNIYSLFGK